MVELDGGTPNRSHPVNKQTSSVPAIEWSPDAVRVWNPSTGKMASGPDLASVASALAGHRTAVVGIARTHCFAKRISLPKADNEDMRRMLQLQIGQHSPLPADQVSFDFVTTDQPCDGGFAALLCMVRNDDLRQLRQALEKAGIQALSIAPVAFAAPIACARAGQTSALVVDHWLGSPTHDIVLDGSWRYGRTCDPESDSDREIARTWAAVGEEPQGSPVVPESVDGGLLVRFLAQAPTMSLEPLEERLTRERRRRAGRTRFGVLMALAALLLVGLVWDDRDQHEAVLRRGEGVWARQLSQLRSIRRTEQAKAAAAAKVDSALDRAFQVAQTPVDQVQVVSTLLPDGVWLTGLSAERGKTLQVRGTARRAEDIAQFVDRMSASPRFRDVRLLFANGSKIDETPVVQFSITATAIGNLPLPEPDKTSRKSRSTTTKGAKS